MSKREFPIKGYTSVYDGDTFTADVDLAQAC